MKSDHEPAATRPGQWPPTRVELLLMIGTTLAFGWPLLVFPLGLDQGIYAVVAARMWRGMALYSQAWDMKPPGIFFLYMIPVGLGGFRVWPIQIAHLVMHFAAALALFRLMVWWVGRGPAWATFLCYMLLSCNWGTPITNGQPDDWMLPFFLWGFYLLASAWLVGKGKGGLRAFWAGVLMGWVLVMRTTMLFAVILLPVVWIVVLREKAEARQRLGSDDLAAEEGTARWHGHFGKAARLLGWYVAGGLVIGAATLGYFVLTGSLDDLVYGQVVWVRNYAQTFMRWEDFSWGRYKILFLSCYGEHCQAWWLINWAIPLGALGLLIRWRLGKKTPRFAVILWALGFLFSASSMLIQAKFFNYHFWAILPFTAMASAFGLWAIGEGWVALWRSVSQTASGRRRTSYRGACIGLVFLALFGFYKKSGIRDARRRQKTTFQYLVGMDRPAKFFARFTFRHIYRADEDWELSRYILSRTPPGQSPKVFIWGFRPAIYFLCGVVGPSRFCYNLPLRANWSPPEWLENLEKEVMADPPDFLILSLHDFFDWVVGNDLQSEQVVPEWLDRDLHANFRLVKHMKFIEMWERNTVPEQAAPAK